MTGLSSSTYNFRESEDRSQQSLNECNKIDCHQHNILNAQNSIRIYYTLKKKTRIYDPKAAVNGNVLNSDRHHGISTPEHMDKFSN